jgi:hypothetical protein
MKRKHWYVAKFIATANRQNIMGGGLMKRREVGGKKNNKVFCGECFVSTVLLKESQKRWTLTLRLLMSYIYRVIQEKSAIL